MSFSAWAGEAANADGAEQRVADGAGLGDAGLKREVLVLVDRDADDVARAEAVLGRSGSGGLGQRLGARPSSARRGEGGGEVLIII